MRYLILLVFLVIPLKAFADNYAVVDSNGNVVNVIVMNNPNSIAPPQGDKFVLIPPNTSVGTGWTYSFFSGFTAPPASQ